MAGYTEKQADRYAVIAVAIGIALFLMGLFYIIRAAWQWNEIAGMTILGFSLLFVGMTLIRIASD